MSWFKRDRPRISSDEKRNRSPEGLWIKCDSFKEVIYRKEVDRKGKVCPKCNYHFPISVDERIDSILDEGTFKEWERHISPLDPLLFKDSIRYKERLKLAFEKTQQRDAIVVGEGTKHTGRGSLL